MDVEDFLEPEIAITATVAAALFSPRGRSWLRRGLVYGTAGVLMASDAVTSFARSIGRGAQQAGATIADGTSQLTGAAQATGTSQPTATTQATGTSQPTETTQATGTSQPTETPPEVKSSQASEVKHSHQKNPPTTKQGGKE
jgi:hypothetical protein